jgi:hypothetical protein
LPEEDLHRVLHTSTVEALTANQPWTIRQCRSVVFRPCSVIPSSRRNEVDSRGIDLHLACEEINLHLNYEGTNSPHSPSILAGSGINEQMDGLEWSLLGISSDPCNLRNAHDSSEWPVFTHLLSPFSK